MEKDLIFLVGDAGALAFWSILLEFSLFNFFLAEEAVAPRVGIADY